MLKFAVIGIGRMGFRHAYNLHMHFIPGAKLVAVADIDEKAQEKAKKLAEAQAQATQQGGNK